MSQIEKGNLIDSLNRLSNTVAKNEIPNTGYKGTTLESLLQINNQINDNSDSETLFRDGDPIDRTVASARDTYNREVSKGSHQFREAMQDSMLSLKTLYKAILGKGKDIKDVPEYENAYIAENALSSAVKAQQDEYSRKFGRPLIEALRLYSSIFVNTKVVGVRRLYSLQIQEHRPLCN